jgi:hypothetical protein
VISVIFALAAVTAAFWFPLAAWLPIALVLGTAGLMALAVRGQQYEGVQLSSVAQMLLQEQGHVYGAPFAAAQFAGASSVMALTSILVLVIDLIKGFWWGLAIALPLFIVGMLLGRFYNPTTFYTEFQALGHAELVAYLQAGGTLRRIK